MFYNQNIDVAPLTKAISISFKTFYEMFGLDATTCITLPRLAQLAMWRNYDQSCPYIFTFQPRYDFVRKIFREKLTGGLCNVMWVCYKS